MVAQSTINEHLNVHRFGTRHCSIKVIELKPKNHAVAVGSLRGVAQCAMLMRYFPLVQLEYQLAGGVESLVFFPSVPAGAAQQPLIPSAGSRYIVDTDEWSEVHVPVPMVTLEVLHCSIDAYLPG